MSWYRRYRPTQVSELHLSNVRETLLQFMKKGKIPQVLLFAGPKGTGKTSSARIIGALLNDDANAAMVDYQFFGKDKPSKPEYAEPDSTNEFNQKIFAGQSFVVQEMDAASNRGIDDVRALKERVMLPPQQGKMTVYILDEAHMLTTEAFNALLKLLEEPPKHVVFILATTELHKVPDTIVSRSSVVQFRKATDEEMVAAMNYVLGQEKISSDNKALFTIANHADGSFRDAVKMLEMVAAEGEITAEKVELLLHSSVSEKINQVIDSVVTKNEEQLALVFQELRSSNVSEQFFFKTLLDTLHVSLMQSLGVTQGEAMVSRQIALFLLKELSQLPQTPTPIPFLHLEIKLLELIDRAKQKSGTSGNGGEIAKPPSTKIAAKKIVSTVKVNEAKVTHASSGDSQQLIQKWKDLLMAVKERNATLEALLRSAKPVLGQNGTAKVAVFYKFHKEQLENPKFRSVIDECVVPLAGGPINFEYILSDVPADAELSDQVDDELVTLAEEALI